MYIAIVKTENNRVAKYDSFPTQAEAEDHVSQYGGFVYDNANNDPISDLFVSGQTVTVVPVDRSQEKLKRLKSEAINALVVEQNEALLDAARLRFQAGPNDPTLAGIVKGYFQAEQNQ